MQYLDRSVLQLTACFLPVGRYLGWEGKGEKNITCIPADIPAVPVCQCTEQEDESVCLSVCVGGWVGG